MSFSLFELVPAVYRLRDGQMAATMQLLTPDEQTELAVLQDSRTHLINILWGDICETEVAQGVSADRHGRPLGTDRRTMGVGGTSLASGASRG
jgi:hypothetical protein